MPRQSRSISIGTESIHRAHRTVQRFSSRVGPKFNRRHQNDAEGVCTKAIMTTANHPSNNLSPWKPGQSGNSSGRPKGTRDLAGYVLETADAGRDLIDALVCIARGVMPNVAVQEGSRPRKDHQVRPADQLKAIEMLLDRRFGRSPQQLDIGHSVTDRPLKHLSDDMLQPVGGERQAA